MFDLDDLFDDLPSTSTDRRSSPVFMGLASFKDYVDSEDIDLAKLDDEQEDVYILGTSPNVVDILTHWPEIVVGKNINIKTATKIMPHQYVLILLNIDNLNDFGLRYFVGLTPKMVYEYSKYIKNVHNFLGHINNLEYNNYKLDSNVKFKMSTKSRSWTLDFYVIVQYLEHVSNLLEFLIYMIDHPNISHLQYIHMMDILRYFEDTHTDIDIDTYVKALADKNVEVSMLSVIRSFILDDCRIKKSKFYGSLKQKIITFHECKSFGCSSKCMYD
jgi:hypothetical protein